MYKISIIILSLFLILACKSKKINSDIQETKAINSNILGEGVNLKIQFHKGEAFNHPSFAFWIENMEGKFIETLFVTKSVGTGIFNYGKNVNGKWEPDQKRYPATLPYWSHKRGIISSDGLFVPDSMHKVVDGITGATPQTNFDLWTKVSDKSLRKFKLLFEVNQTWDYNEFWTNNKYPDNAAYKTSCQPSLIYETTIDLKEMNNIYEMKVIGHGHYAGENDSLYTDLSTLTTALQIVDKIEVRVMH